MKKVWKVDVNGTTHTITYKTGYSSKLIIDNAQQKLKSSSWFIQLIDHPIQLGDVDCRLVVVGNKVDLAVNGYYQGSGKPYSPIQELPKWLSILAGISVILGGFLNGAIGAGIGALLAMFYYNIALKGKTSNAVIAFVVCTVLQVIFAIGLASLVGAI